MSVLNNLLTGKDNETHDIGRWLCIIYSAVGIGLVLYTVIGRGEAFSLEQFGIGTAAIAGGFGAFLKLKESTEP
jgi:hypothetical protein